MKQLLLLSMKGAYISGMLKESHAKYRGIIQTQGIGQRRERNLYENQVWFVLRILNSTFP